MSNSELAVVDGEVVPQQSALTVIGRQQNAADLYRHATDVAGVCGEIVKRTAQNIQGRKYIKVEGWQTIANTFGCVASARDVERVATGYRAIGEVRRMSDGAVIAAAEGFVGDDEPVWSGGTDGNGKKHAARPEYAKRAMCQTRAISRACRTAFAFVVVMIDGELSTTPAEEVPEGGFHDASKAMPAPAGVDKLREQLGPRPSPKTSGIARQHEDICFKFGNKKGVPVSQLDEGALRWYAGACERDIADPSKAQWAANAQRQLASIRAELTFRGLA